MEVLDSPKVDEDLWQYNVDIRKSFADVRFVLCLMHAMMPVADAACARGSGSNSAFRRTRFAGGFTEPRSTKGRGRERRRMSMPACSRWSGRCVSFGGRMRS
jgi:hypothetical protein